MTGTKLMTALAAGMIWAATGYISTALADEEGGAGTPQPLLTDDGRVRAFTPRVKSILADAATGSPTFGRLLSTIAKTDGLVYVAEGRCDKGRLRACLLLNVTIAGPNRMLRIVIDPRASDLDLMESIGHELQHVIEVLRDVSIRSDAAMLMHYRQGCQICGGPCRRCGAAFDTEEAVAAGHAVRKEMRKTGVADDRRVAPQDTVVQSGSGLSPQ